LNVWIFNRSLASAIGMMLALIDLNEVRFKTYLNVRIAFLIC
jgi:hypothetical protein